MRIDGEMLQRGTCASGIHKFVNKLTFDRRRSRLSPCDEARGLPNPDSIQGYMMKIKYLLAASVVSLSAAAATIAT
ncbi:MAG: hypothetical protein C0510_13725, partial [Erythrobacter sp.]|nr:hypothetical protein [Erythrobacter sp.]